MGKKIQFQKRLPDNWIEKGIEMASSGATETEVHSSFGLSVDTHEEYKKNHPAYKDQADKWHAMSLAYYLKIGRENLGNKNFKYKEWTFIMQNVFNWGQEEKEPTESGSEKNDDDTPEESVSKGKLDINQFKNAV